MKKLLSIFLSYLLLAISTAHAYKPYRYPRRTSFRTRKTYVRKSPYAGFGRRSSINYLPKTKIINGHGKKTRNGYAYVYPYARSR